MKHSSARKGLALAAALLFAGSSISFAQSAPASLSKKDVDKWVKSKAYAPGFKPTLDPSVNTAEFAKQYNANKAVWDKVFAFLQNPELGTMRGGHVNIDGENGENAYAIFTNEVPKDFSVSNWEVHKKYIDVHYVIEGKEKIAGVPFAKVENVVVTPFDDAKDIGYYKYDFENYLTATPDNFFIYFPGEAHRPHLKVDPAFADKIKKVVVKVKMIN